MGFIEAVRSALGKYVTFSGRARRAEYWWFALFNVLTSIVATILDVIAFGPDMIDGRVSGPISLLASLALLLPGLAVWFRRLHDVGRSGWWGLLVLVPIIGWIVLFYWSVRRGDVGPNAYGPDPITGTGSSSLSDIPAVPRR